MTAKIELNYEVFDALLQFKVTLAFCADYLKCSEDTIRRRLEEDHGMTFSQYHELKMQRTAVKLQQKALELALSGKSNSVLIFSLKNIAGWTDKQETTNPQLNETIEQYLKRVHDQQKNEVGT